MLVESCLPVVPSTDLERSLRFWVDGLGLTMDRPMRQDGRLVGCMVHNEKLWFWLNQRAALSDKPEHYEGLRLYWTPNDLGTLRERLERLGFHPTPIVERDYGQTEFTVIDEDGYSHCFGIPTKEETSP